VPSEKRNARAFAGLCRVLLDFRFLILCRILLGVRFLHSPQQLCPGNFGDFTELWGTLRNSGISRLSASFRVISEIPCNCGLLWTCGKFRSSLDFVGFYRVLPDFQFQLLVSAFPFTPHCPWPFSSLLPATEGPGSEQLFLQAIARCHFGEITRNGKKDAPPGFVSDSPNGRGCQPRSR